MTLMDSIGSVVSVLETQPQKSYVHGVSSVPLLGITIGACLDEAVIGQKIATEAPEIQTLENQASASRSVLEE